MLILMFRAGSNRYAIDAGSVIEVVPRVDFRPLPRSPDYLLGVLGYRGGIVPVVDLSILLGGPPCRDALSSRVILVNAGENADRRGLLGLLAESVTRVRNVSAERLVSSALNREEIPYLGGILNESEGLVQLVLADKLNWERLQPGNFVAEETV